ncbi:hypothetical protein C8R45DRAFT_147236 [Mycena sanguinolenta]|nr:hypothetical protein C8R45DRAFT_147236 [Mycena sanguinolenta]
MSAALVLSDLAPDVIFSILACCDIASVVSVGQTCRCLHTLAFDKSVWLGLLHNLQRRAILDQNCTPSLETFSKDEMIGVVRRLLTGPLTWSPQDLDSDSAPKVSKKITLHPFGTHPGALDRGNRAKLLPSGRYILFPNSCTTLECWNLTDNKMAWRYTTAIEHAEVYDFAAEERETGSTIMTLICIRTYPHDNKRQNYVEIVGMDIQRGTQNCLLTARAPDCGYDNPLHGPVIYGNLAAVNTGSQHMILNWATQSYLIVDGYPGSHAARIALIPEHIILMNRSLDRKNKIHLIANDALTAYLVPIITPDDETEFSPILAEDIPKRGTFEDTHAERAVNDMHVHESPLREGDWRIWICGTKHAAHTSGLFSCMLSIPSNGEPRWCQRSQSVRSGMLPYTPVSYSGQLLQRSSSGEYIAFSAACPAAPKRAVVMPEFHGRYIGFAAYSGALTYCTRSSIVLQYYK